MVGFALDANFAITGCIYSNEIEKKVHNQEFLSKCLQ